MIENLAKKYSRIVASYPGAILVLLFVMAGFIASGATQIEQVSQNNEDFLPDTVPSVKAFDIIGAEFGQGGGGSTYTILFETAPEYANSNELRDIRESQMINYIETVSNDIESFKEVTTVSSVADLVEDASTKRDVINQLEASEQASSYVSEDKSFTIMRISSTDISASEEEELASMIKTSVERIERPPGIETGYTGQPFINQAFQEQSQSTQGQTSILSLIGVFLVVILLFRSIVSGLTSLSALIFGIMTGVGVFGWLGLNLSPATSGAISMGIGIAIDFGIQTVSRYKEERRELGIEKSLTEMFVGVINPMSIALIASIIGFTALSFGRITFLSDLGTILTLTTTFAFIGALTVIPTLLVIYDKHLKKYFPESFYNTFKQTVLGDTTQ